jgi:nucleotide-binding universal stress UspA family protein
MYWSGVATRRWCVAESDWVPTPDSAREFMTADQSAGTAAENRVVVGVDGSDPSKQALRWAGFLSRSMSATVEAVTVWHQTPGYGFVPPPSSWSPATDAETILHDTVHAVFGDRSPDGMRLTVREGGAAGELLKASEGARMLVVGSRGHGGFAGLLLGSVSAACAEHAVCPVLVVHGATPPPPA